MDGFKNSTKTHYMKGGSCEGYAKGGKVKGAAKIAKVMGEFKAGKLHSGSKSGPEVTNPKQATAIALSEAREAGASIKPIKRGPGGRATLADLERANSDTGGMSKRAVEAAGEAIARGNRVAVEEGKESRLVGRRATPRTREATVENTRTYSRAEPAEPMSDLNRRLSTLPSQRGELRRGPAGSGFSVTPLVSTVRNVLGLKKGGLSAMPRGKKC